MEMPHNATEILRFDGLEIDGTGGRIRYRGEEIALPPQPMRVLVYLAERPGRVVSRAELRVALWPDRYVEFDQSLNFAIRQIRRALGEGRHTSNLIETVPRLGYRFAAGPVLAEAEAMPALARSAPNVQRMLLGGVGALVLIGLGLGFVALRTGRGAKELGEPQVIHLSVAAVSGGDSALAVNVAGQLAGALRTQPSIRVVLDQAPGIALLVQVDSVAGGQRVVATLSLPEESRPRWRAAVGISFPTAARTSKDLAEDVAVALHGIGRGARMDGRSQTVVIE